MVCSGLITLGSSLKSFFTLEGRGTFSEKLDVFGLHIRYSHSKYNPDIQSTLPSHIPSRPLTTERHQTGELRVAAGAQPQTGTQCLDCHVMSDFSEDCALAGILMNSQGVDVPQKGTLQKRGSHLYRQATILCRKNINEIWIGIRHQERTAAVRGNLNCTMNYT